MAPDPAHSEDAVARLKAGQSGEAVIEALIGRGMEREAARLMVAQLLELKLAADKEAQGAHLHRELQGALLDAARAEHANKASLAAVFGVLFVAGGAVGISLGGYALRVANGLEAECGEAAAMGHHLPGRCQAYSSANSVAWALLPSGVFCLLLGIFSLLVARARGRAARAHR